MARALTPEQRAERRREQARQFLSEVERFVPEDQRETFATVRSAIEAAPEAADFIGNAVLRQQEGTRLVNELNEERRQLGAERTLLDRWWRDNQEAARVGAAAIEQQIWDPAQGTFRTPTRARQDDDLGDGDPHDGGGGTPRRFVDDDRRGSRQDAHPPRRPEMTPFTEDRARALAQEFETQTVAFTADVASISSQHLREFNEPLDVHDLISFARESNLPLRSAYAEYVGDRRRTREQQAVEERIAAAREEGRLEALRTAHPGPYPAPSAASPVMQRLAGSGDQSAAEFGVEAAVREFNELTSRRGG